MKEKTKRMGYRQKCNKPRKYIGCYNQFIKKEEGQTDRQRHRQTDWDGDRQTTDRLERRERRKKTETNNLTGTERQTNRH